MYRFREGVTSEQIAALEEALSLWPSQIGEIREFRYGYDIGDRSKELPPMISRQDFFLTASFDNKEDYATFDNHPAKAATAEKYLLPLVAEITGIDLSHD